MKIKRLLALFLSIALVIGCTGQWTVRAEEAEEPALNPTLTQTTGTATAVPVEDETVETEDHPFLRYIDETQFLSADHAARLPEEERLDTYVFLNRDGTKTVYHMGRNVKFVDTDGTVVDKDTTLVATDGGYTMRRNDVQLLLPEEASTGVFLALGDYGVRLVPQGGSGTAVMENNAVVFEDYYGEGMTLKYSPMLSGVKEDIILESYTGVSSFSFGLVGYGLGLYERDGAWCLAPSETAETVFALGDVLVYDAIGKPVMGTMTAQEVRSGVYTVTISAPVEFLTDPTTVYPVTIDPTLQVRDTSTQTQIEDAPVFSNYPNSSFGTYVFNTIGDAGETYGIGRTAVRLKGLLSDETYQGLSADEIVKAEFYIKDGGSYYTNVNIYAITNNTTWTESTATWNNLNYDTTTVYATNLMGGGEWEAFDITTLVQAWKNGTQNGQCGFMMVLADETKYVGTLSCEYGTGENWPYAVLTYDDNGVLSDTKVDINEGSTFQLSAINPDGLSLTWTSDDPSVATVSRTGAISVTVTAVNAGSTTIRVSSADNSINASCVVHVKIPDGVYYIKNAALSKYLRNTGGDVGIANQDTSSETKYRQLWKITYVSNGRYAIRPMNDTSEALTIGTGGYISVANAISNNTALSSSYLWTIGRDSTGVYFQQNGTSNKTITTQVNGTTTIVYPGTYSSSTYCHWTLELVTGVYLRDRNTLEIIPPSTVKYIELGETLTLDDLAIIHETSGISGKPSWSSSNESVASVAIYAGAVTGIKRGQAIITISLTINDNEYSTQYAVICKKTFQLDVIYDNAYNERYTGATSRIINHLAEMQEFYLAEFYIMIEFQSPQLFASYADTNCDVAYSDRCSVGTCWNSDFDGNGVLNLEDYHHKNITNIVLRIPFPDVTETYKIAFIGHSICYSSSGFCNYDGLEFNPISGIAYPAIGLIGITNTRSTELEFNTTLHEMGHLWGAPDHYGGLYPTTEQIGDSGQYSGAFSQTCIYGEEKLELAGNPTICEGCHSAIEAYLETLE